MNRIILKKDLIIPAGTVFEDCDGVTVQFGSGNFESSKGTGKDGVISLYLNEDVVRDNPEQFEIVD